MTTVVTCEIVKNGLSDPLMRKVATKIAEECTSTGGFNAKLTQIEDFNQRAKPQKWKTPVISQKAHATITQYAIEKATLRGIKEGREMQKRKNAIEEATLRGIEEQREMQKQRKQLTCQRCKQRLKKSHRTHGRTMLVQYANTQQQPTIMRMVRASPGVVGPQGPLNRQLLETGRS
jgi:hypothetical protein